MAVHCIRFDEERIESNDHIHISETWILIVEVRATDGVKFIWMCLNKMLCYMLVFDKLMRRLLFIILVVFCLTPYV